MAEPRTKSVNNPVNAANSTPYRSGKYSTQAIIINRKKLGFKCNQLPEIGNNCSTIATKSMAIKGRNVLSLFIDRPNHIPIFQSKN